MELSHSHEKKIGHHLGRHIYYDLIIQDCFVLFPSASTLGLKLMEVSPVIHFVSKSNGILREQSGTLLFHHISSPFYMTQSKLAFNQKLCACSMMLTSCLC